MSIAWNLYQSRQIDDVKHQSTRAEDKANRMGYDIRELHDKVDGLALTCQAMWELIRDRTNLTEEDIEAKMQEIDFRDGSVDGKMSKQGKCPSCSRPVSKRHDNCMYCGAHIPKHHVFQ